jgi:hypothetical protein
MTTKDIFNEIANAPDLDLHPATFLAIPGMVQVLHALAENDPEDEDDLDVELTLRIDAAKQSISEHLALVRAHASGCFIHPEAKAAAVVLPALILERLASVGALAVRLALKTSPRD